MHMKSNYVSSCEKLVGSANSIKFWKVRNVVFLSLKFTTDSLKRNGYSDLPKWFLGNWKKSEAMINEVSLKI